MPNADEHPVCICTMSYDPRNRVRAVTNAAHQTYKNKYLFLLYQMVDGRFPKHFEKNDYNFTIKEIDVGHITGKNWWAKKMIVFLHAVKTVYPNIDPICAIMDEDDGFEPRYLEKAVKALEYHNCKAVWNYTNMLVNKDGFQIKRHREPIGTLVAYYSCFRNVMDRAIKNYPTLTNGLNDPLDAKWRAIMQTLYKPQDHGGMREFIQWSGSSTRRNKGLEIDS